MKEIDWNNTYLYLRGFLELLNFLSGAIIATLGFFVFRQLKLAQESIETAKDALTTAKNDIQIRIKREAVILAAEQVEKFGKEIIPKVGKIIDECTTKTIFIDEWELKNHLFNESSINNLNQADEWLSNIKDTEIQTQVIQVLNEHEAFAMYFVGGAADELVAFPSTATVFCSNVKRLVPMLLALRNANFQSKFASGAFQKYSYFI